MIFAPGYAYAAMSLGGEVKARVVGHGLMCERE